MRVEWLGEGKRGSGEATTRGIIGRGERRKGSLVVEEAEQGRQAERPRRILTVRDGEMRTRPREEKRAWEYGVTSSTRDIAELIE